MTDFTFCALMKIFAKSVDIVAKDGIILLTKTKKKAKRWNAPLKSNKNGTFA
ncbi:hypothetical protein [Streptococcus danieliae]|uniref:hypothetical protein n=1 Tax=Streptococcus danieliae TaxID=747656 RepID=UPI0021C6CC30|nr:hypothetical protein [Streptococcus danieliae]